ncbi:YheT family hydrolase [Haloferula chungangensis]|uniref:YheT family hydrolase n=1 Tax=Haloferula chungangensis TaxID=1048331 RepID=A0ABW2LBL6_9BACT
MPLVSDSSYRPPLSMPGGHLQTIIPALYRKAERVTREKERLELADGDFLDLEWHRDGRRKLVILSHGLEGDAGASYIQSMARMLSPRGWDVLAWNYRGCSEELNRLPRFYHSGATEDLSAVIEHALDVHPAEKIDLIGFSLGGNMTLKYLGERGAEVSPVLGRAVTFSVPCDLACSSRTLDTAFNREVYMRRFIKTLAEKVRRKHVLFPDDLDPKGLEKIRTFREFDNRYTAPLHGFRDAADYWERSSSRQYLSGIRIPALMVNARNDPFLGPGCFPEEEADESRYFYLESPKAGGHVGFPTKDRGAFWMGQRAIRFLEDAI